MAVGVRACGPEIVLGSRLFRPSRPWWPALAVDPSLAG
jgi:hypothetical protein